MPKTNHVRFGIRHLLLMLTVAALATVSLVFATPLWSSLWFSTSMAVLLMATALLIVSSGNLKAFWIGVAIFGWGYWAILHSSFLSSAGPGGTWRLGNAGPPLWSNGILEWIYNEVLPAVHEEPTFANGVQTNSSSSRYPNGITFMQVGHSLFGLAVAFIGGFAVSAFSQRMSLPVPTASDSTQNQDT